MMFIYMMYMCYEYAYECMLRGFLCKLIGDSK